MRIIKVEGYKAFHGDMLIRPKNTLLPSYYIQDKDWLYQPTTDCWYGDGRSFPSEVCEPVDNDNINRDE